MKKATIYWRPAILLGVVLIAVLPLCDFPGPAQEHIMHDSPLPQSKEETCCAVLPEKEPPGILDIEVKENKEEELVFSVSIEDYIDSYNSYWQYDFGRALLTPHQQWRQFRRKPSIHSSHETNCFCFTENERVYSLPTITVYVPTSGKYIQEITVDFDDHSYTESGFAQFKKMCFYGLKVFFPDMANDKLQALCAEIILLGNRNLRESDQWYGPDPVPCALFHRNGIGIYPYYAIGDWEHFCIIPVTSDTIHEMEHKGVKIYEIE